MRKSSVALGVAIVLTFGAGVGAALAQGGGPAAAPATSMDAMHASMRTAMPAEREARCDARHAAMSAHIPAGAASMMGDASTTGSMMGGTSMWSSDHAAHHQP